MKQAIIRSVLTLAVLSNAIYMSAAAKPTNTPQSTAAIFRFEAPSASTTKAIASQACAAYQESGLPGEASTQVQSAPLDPQLLDVISSELEKGLGKKRSVLVDPNSNEIPVGSIVISGCILQAEKGNAAGRMMGMGAGASHLSAHIVLLAKTETGFARVNSFDLDVKGRSFMPPTPATLAVNAATAKSKTLSADAKKLAAKIVKKVESEKTGRRQTSDQ
jgi:hypothetical protein